jgi:hypothetical protein
LDTDEHVREVGDGVDPIRLAGRDERVQAREVLAGLVRSDEEEVLSAQGGDAEGALGGVVVDGQVLVGEEERQGIPLAELHARPSRARPSRRPIPARRETVVFGRRIGVAQTCTRRLRWLDA